MRQTAHSLYILLNETNGTQRLQTTFNYISIKKVRGSLMKKTKMYITTFYMISTLFLSNVFAMEDLPFKEYEADRYPVSALAFSPDGNTLAIGYNDAIRLVNIESNEIINTIIANRKISGEIVFSSDGKFIACGIRNDVRVWRTTNGRRFKNFKGHEAPVTCVSFSSDGKFIASGSEDESIRIWNLNEEEPLHLLIPNPTNFIQEIQRIFFIPNSHILIAVHFGHSRLRFWDTNTGSLFKEIETWYSDIFSVDFSNDWKRLVFGAYGGMQLWDLENEELLRNIIGPFERDEYIEQSNHTFFDVDLSPDEKTIVATQGTSMVELWDATMTRRKPIAILEGHEGTVTHVAFSPDGRLVASSDTQGIVRLWDVDLFLSNQEKKNVSEDINEDGKVNIQDLVIVANHFGTSYAKADVNGDGTVNIQDLVTVANAFTS